MESKGYDPRYLRLRSGGRVTSDRLPPEVARAIRGDPLTLETHKRDGQLVARYIEPPFCAVLWIFEGGDEQPETFEQHIDVYVKNSKQGTYECVASGGSDWYGAIITPAPAQPLWCSGFETCLTINGTDMRFTSGVVSEPRYIRILHHPGTGSTLTLEDAPFGPFVLRFP